MEQIVVFGGGGHGKTLLDLLGALGTYRVAGVVDDGLTPAHTVVGVPVIGGAGVLAELASRGVTLAVNAVGGITAAGMARRVAVFEQLLAAGLACPSLVHPTAWVEPSAQLEAGVQVL
ncbi:MAG: acetyltransferase, partial [Acidimicrobiales bacterium]